MNDRYRVTPPVVLVPELPNEAHVRAIIREEIAAAEDRIVERVFKMLTNRLRTRTLP